MGSILGIKPPKPAPITPPAPMPTMDDAKVQEAKKKQMLANSQRSGRVSTILSDGVGTTDKVGG